MKEPVSFDLFPDDVLPFVVDRSEVVFARDRFLFRLAGSKLRLSLGVFWVTANDDLRYDLVIEGLRDALASLGGLGGVW